MHQECCIHSDLHMPGGQDFPSSHSILEIARTSYILSCNNLTVEVKLKSKEIENAFFHIQNYKLFLI